MCRFYGDDIDKIQEEYLLKATPFIMDTRINFSNNLTPEIFFENLYTDKMEDADNEVNKENNKFDKDIENCLRTIDNKFAKVDLIHIAGYGGCGKTTYIRHLLWELNKTKMINNDILDFEGSKTVKNPFIKRICEQIICDVENISIFFDNLLNDNIFDLSRFQKVIFSIEELHEVIAFPEKKNKEELLQEIKQLFVKQEGKFKVYDDYIYSLITIDFLLQIFKGFNNSNQFPLIIVFDNVDSISDISEEKALVSALKIFINDCNFFFGMNITNTKMYKDELVSDAINNIKLTVFLTTRIITIKKYLELEPDLEKVYGWVSFKMPQNYYSHYMIINTRIKYYKKEEGEHSTKKVINKMKKLDELAYIMYRTQNFKRLFNGNIRFCFDTLCNLYSLYIMGPLLDESINVFRRKNEIREAFDGAQGIILSMLFNYLKDNGVYDEKLHLSECQCDHEVSLSRIILTIIREKGGTCSLLDIFQLLGHMKSLKEICNIIWDLSEAKRDYWRRLINFDVKFPHNPSDLYTQAELFQDGDYDVEKYSEINVCTAGIAYIDNVIPHFEFMLSRHRYGVGKVENLNYQPLFCSKSEDLLQNGTDEQKYRFEKKIDWVFYDVSDCCINSVYFANKVMEIFKLDRTEYINNTYYNYHTNNRDGTVGYRQSYESRLIFSHIGYIERYRRYLLKKYKGESRDKLRDINQRIIKRIKRYLNLYSDEDKCFHSYAQDEAVKILNGQIEIINNSNYFDFKTKIEIRKDISS